MNRKHPTIEVRPSPVDSLGSGWSSDVTLESERDPEGVAATLPELSEPFASIDINLASVDGSNEEDGDEPIGPMPSVGDVIGGVYRVLGELGRGAMGVVLLAEDQHLKRKVAIKLVRPELMGPGFRKRFMEEARAMARVNHPNVVTIYASGTHGSLPYFVMELVDGQTVDAWLAARPRPIDLDVALAMLNDVCTGVAAIHAAGTVHRDIKPSNILVGADSRIRITDFGVSTVYRDGATTASELVGTPAYMAPEVAFAPPDAATTPRVDVYSLGCVAYELITGRLPFESDGELAMMVRHATEPVPLPSTIRPELPRAFDTILLQALAKKPEERTASVELLRRGLQSARRESLEPIRILIAEDDDDFRDLLEYQLRMEFPEAAIEAAADGRAALATLERGTPSVAVLDLQMPYLDGISLTALLRAREECRTMPIIVLTASGGPKEWKQLSSMGVDRFLVKPINLDDMVVAIRNAIRERSSAPPPVPSAAAS